jgi:hypothetical protein
MGVNFVILGETLSFLRRSLLQRVNYGFWKSRYRFKACHGMLDKEILNGLLKTKTYSTTEYIFVVKCDFSEKQRSASLRLQHGRQRLRLIQLAGREKGGRKFLWNNMSLLCFGHRYCDRSRVFISFRILVLCAVCCKCRYRYSSNCCR